jgi:hypothetical protein
LAQIKADIRALEAREKSVKDALYPILGDAEVVIYGGEEAATYRANKDSEKTNWQALAERLIHDYAVTQELRDFLLKSYTFTVPGARILRLSKTLEAA